MPRGANPTRESGRSVSALLTGGLWASAELAEYMVLIGLFSSYTYYVDQDTRRVFTRRRVLAGAEVQVGDVEDARGHGRCRL